MFVARSIRQIGKSANISFCLLLFSKSPIENRFFFVCACVFRRISLWVSFFWILICQFVCMYHNQYWLTSLLWIFILFQTFWILRIHFRHVKKTSNQITNNKNKRLKPDFFLFVWNLHSNVRFRYWFHWHVYQMECKLMICQRSWIEPKQTLLDSIQTQAFGIYLSVVRFAVFMAGIYVNLNLFFIPKAKIINR